MKRPQHWLRRIVLCCLLVILAEYVTLTWIAPRYAIRMLQRLIGHELVVDRARPTLSLTTRFDGLRYRHNTQEAALTVRHAVIRPGRLGFSPWTVDIAAVEVDRPFVRITRTAAGPLYWPWVPGAPTVVEKPAPGPLARALAWLMKRCRIQVDTIRVADGTVEFIDGRTSPPFHAVFDHVTVNVGPLTFPRDADDQVSFAVRGLLSGAAEGYAAPAYCSGWVAVGMKDLQVSCQLEPLPLALFNPYFQRSHKVIRVYSATLASTSRWEAKAGRMDARIHLEMDRLNEGDISVRGVNIIDIKKLAPSGERRLAAEVTLSGAMGEPAGWRGDFTPGNEPTQRLVEQLLERDIKALRLPVAGRRVALNLTPASEAAMQDIEAVSKNISDALEILATPLVYQVPADVPAPLAAPRRPLSIPQSTTWHAPGTSEAPEPSEAPAEAPVP